MSFGSKSNIEIVTDELQTDGVALHENMIRKT